MATTSFQEKHTCHAPPNITQLTVTQKSKTCMRGFPCMERPISR
jgi:hypothetical protein